MAWAMAPLRARVQDMGRDQLIVVGKVGVTEMPMVMVEAMEVVTAVAMERNKIDTL